MFTNSAAEFHEGDGERGSKRVQQICQEDDNRRYLEARDIANKVALIRNCVRRFSGWEISAFLRSRGLRSSRYMTCVSGCYLVATPARKRRPGRPGRTSPSRRTSRPNARQMQREKTSATLDAGSGLR
jgi:hypothetical protein